MIIAIVTALSLSSCSKQIDANDTIKIVKEPATETEKETEIKTEKEDAESGDPVSTAVYIDDTSTNASAYEQSISDLYKNAGVNEKLISKDPFGVALSHNDYFYTDDIYLEITSNIENAEIYYTLDSSVPSKDKVNGNSKNKGTIKYTKPILFKKADNNAPYVIKIKAYANGGESRLITHTYFVSSAIYERFDSNTFIFSISSDPYNLYDYEHGILIEGKLRDDYIKAHGRRDIVPPNPANYNLRGREGERESHIEVLGSDGKLLVSQIAGIRVHGGWSRASDVKSLALYARGEYDPVFDRFYCSFFPGNRRNDEYGSFIYDYKTLLLRNGANDRWGSFMREEFAQGLAKKAGFTDYKEFAPAAVFLNGQYYGYFWLQTFYNVNYFRDKYGLDNRDFLQRLRWYEEPQAENYRKDDEFQKFLDLYDVDNFMLYYAFEIYSRNWDWPHNNRRMWRYTGSDGTYINPYLDGRFRQLLYDDEGAWGDSDVKERTIPRTKNSAPVFGALLKRDDMAEKFCNRMFDLINTVFTYESMENELNRIVDLYDYEISMAIKKKAFGNNMSSIQKSRKSILNFADRRAAYVIEDMVKSFNLNGNVYYVSVKGDKNANVTLNTLNLSGAGNLRSSYFYEHSAILAAKAHPGYLFDHWEINGTKYDKPEMTLNSGYISNGRINAELFIKPDASYTDIAIKRIRLDTQCDVIELYNPGENESAVSDLYLSNDPSDLKKFYIKKVTFPAKSVITYYGRNYGDYIKSLNDESKSLKESRIFDFKIKKGETIYLSDKDGKILQKVYITKNFNTDRNEQLTRNSDGSYNIISLNKK